MKNVNASAQILTLGEASILDLPKVGFFVFTQGSVATFCYNTDVHLKV